MKGSLICAEAVEHNYKHIIHPRVIFAQKNLMTQIPNSLLSLGLFLFSVLSLLPLPLLLFPQLCQVFPLGPVGPTLLQHGSEAGHHLAQQIIAGNTNTTEKSNLKTDIKYYYVLIY